MRIALPIFSLLLLLSSFSFASVIWSSSATDSITGKVALSGNRAVYASYDGWIYCVSADTGTILWTLNSNEKISLEPQMADATTVAVATEGSVLFINVNTGSLVAKSNLEKLPLSLAAADGRAFVAFNGSVQAVGMDGAVAWKSPIDGLPGSIGYSDGFAMLTAGSKLYSFSAANGAPRWPAVAAEDSFLSRPSEYDGTIYFGATDGRLYAVDAASSRVRWSYQTGGWVAGTPSASSSAVYFGSLDGNLYSLTTGGTFRWKFATNGAIQTQPELYSSQGHLVAVFGSSDGNVYGVDTSNGQEMWSYSAYGKPSSPARYRDYFIFTTSKGRVYALSPSPICSFIWPASGDAAGNWPIDFEGRASSDYGLQGVDIRVEGSQWTGAVGKENWHATLDMNGMEAGVVNVQCRARDSSGKAETGDFSFITLVKSDNAPLQQMFIVSPQLVQQNESFSLAVKDVRGRNLRDVLLKIGSEEHKGDSPFAVVLGKSGLVSISAEKDGFAPASIVVKGIGGADILVPVMLAAVLLLAFYFLGWKRLASVLKKK